MNTLSESARPAAGVDPTDVALLQAVADMRPGWVVLRDCLLADDGQGTRARVRYALLHPEIGIALLDVLPGTTTPGAPHRMRRMLDATSFPVLGSKHTNPFRNNPAMPALPQYGRSRGFRLGETPR